MMRQPPPPSSYAPFVAASLAALMLTLGACEDITYGCKTVGYTPLIVEVRDSAGRAQALGATLMLEDGLYKEKDTSGDDTLSIRGADSRGGNRYDLRVSKPQYEDVVMAGYYVPGTACYNRIKPPVILPIVLALKADAPAVRSVYVVPSDFLLDRHPTQATVSLVGRVDANAGLPRGVIWRLTGDTASVDFDPATGIARFRCQVKTGYLTVMAMAMADTTVVGTATLRVQGHPGSSTDPVCP